MGSYSPLCGEKWGVTDQVRGCHLQQKRGSRARRGPRSDVETRSSQSRVFVGKCSSQARIEVETEASQACICLKRDPRV